MATGVSGNYRSTGTQPTGTQVIMGGGQPTGGVTTTQPAGGTTGAPAPGDSNFVMVDNSAPPPPPPVPTPGAQAMADRVFDAVSGPGKDAAREAYGKYDFSGRADYINNRLDAGIKDLADKMVNGQITSKEYEAQVNAFAKQIDAEADAKFGVAPKNPDAKPIPPGSYDWAKRDEVEKKLIDDVVNRVMEDFNAGRITAKELDAAITQQTKGIGAQVDQICGKAPQIVSPMAATPEQAAYQKKLNDALGPMTDKVVEGIVNGTISSKDADAIIKQKTKEIVAQLGPEPGGWQYNSALDTPENFQNSMIQAQQQMQIMAKNGSSQKDIQIYQMQKEAELGMGFPNQMMKMETEDMWKATAMAMKQNGKSDAEIKDYLTQKALDYKEPSPEEITAYQQRATKLANQIAALRNASSDSSASESIAANFP